MRWLTAPPGNDLCARWRIHVRCVFVVEIRIDTKFTLSFIVYRVQFLRVLSMDVLTSLSVSSGPARLGSSISVSLTVPM